MSQIHIDAFLNEARGKEAQALGPAILRLNAYSMPDILVALNSLSSQDQAKFRQAAFDGIPAGNWLEPRSNHAHRWLEDTYLVPESLTAGKARLTVTLTPTPDSPPWTASHYRIDELTVPEH